MSGISGAAVPEPSTWAMMSIGFAAIGFLSMSSCGVTVSSSGRRSRQEACTRTRTTEEAGKRDKVIR
jgi:hypothetical protein